MQLPSAVITLLPNVSSTATSSSAKPFIRFYTTGLLVLLPFPDMSMPFNVVAFTSTVLAFFFGSMFNLTYSTTADIIKRSQQTPVTRIKSRLAGLLARCRRPTKLAAAAEGDEVTGAQGTTATVGEVEKSEAEQLHRVNATVEQTAETGLESDSLTTLTSAGSTTRSRKAHPDISST